MEYKGREYAMFISRRWGFLFVSDVDRKADRRVERRLTAVEEIEQMNLRGEEITETLDAYLGSVPCDLETKEALLTFHGEPVKWEYAGSRARRK